jgi:hypothetical protein
VIWKLYRIVPWVGRGRHVRPEGSRHVKPRERRNPRKPSVVVAVALAPAAVSLATAAVIHLGPASGVAKPAAAHQDAPCCAQIVAAQTPLPNVGAAAGMGVPGDEFAAASRLRVDSRFLPVGVASEQGLQVRTILAARAISAAFPEIREIGGCRPDPLPWHPNGLALDMMIPNPDSAAGIDLGNRIVAYVLANADRFGMQDAIWRGVYYTPNGSSPSGLGHYDHVHVTTTGGGYPKGGEQYLR